MKSIVRKNSLLTTIFLMLMIPLYADTVYEDAEDGNITGWYIYDRWPKGATISNVYDSEKESRVIKVKGMKTKNAMRLIGWKNRTETTIQWKMKTDSWLAVCVVLETEKGFRFLAYSPRDYDKGRNPNYQAYKIKIGLGGDMISDKWVTMTRDLEADLKKHEPDNKLLYVSGFKIRGSTLVDDIRLFNPKVSVSKLKAKEFISKER